MVVNVRLLGFFQMMLGRMYLEVSLDSDSTLEDLWNHFVATYPQFEEDDLRRIAGASLNGVYAPSEQWDTAKLSDGDQVDLLTQMGGG